MSKLKKMALHAATEAYSASIAQGDLQAKSQSGFLVCAGTFRGDGNYCSAISESSEESIPMRLSFSTKVVLLRCNREAALFLFPPETSRL